MNKLIALLAAASLLLALSACSKALIHKSELIQHSKSMTVMNINRMPVPPESQLADKKYILGYEILSTRVLSAPDQDALKKELISSANYAEGGYGKSCEFLPDYAVALDSAVVLISKSPCCKVLMHADGEDVLMELIQGNGVEGKLE